MKKTLSWTLFLFYTIFLIWFVCYNQDVIHDMTPGGDLVNHEMTSNIVKVKLTQRRQGRRAVDHDILASLLKLIPADFTGECDDVLNTSLGRTINMSATYRHGVELMNAKVKTIGDHATKEGYIVLPQEVKLLDHIARMDHVTTVCESGFNLGYSAYNYLSAKSSIIVHSFDLGRWMGTKVMAAHLSRLYKSRLHVHYGDSVQSIPEFISNNPEVKCDLVLVDGGHFLKVALADIRNFARMSVPGRTVLVMDDHPTSWAMSELAPAWETARMAGIFTEVFQCSHSLENRSDFFHTGFSVAIFN